MNRFPVVTLRAALATLSRPNDTLTVSLDNAVDLLAASGGRLTWLDAGETWARIVLARPGVTYPPLTR